VKEKNGTKIHDIRQGSIAEEAGLEPGDYILTINGENITDIFDYRFLITDEQLDMMIKKKDGDIWELDIDKDAYEDLGIGFDDPMIDDARHCANKCIFCFIDQMPKGMRETLYFKDDDTRLSFLSGNYVTLTNVKDRDLDRIIRYRMSPINISVHTTNSDLRVRMLNNKNAGDIVEKIKKLVNAGITVNCQIVLCRGINDGDELDRTISDLSSLYPWVNSISVVPVGITKYREELTYLLPYDKVSASRIIEQVNLWQEKLITEKGSRVAYLADEFYIMADYKIPEYEDYEDFPQLENGIGLISLFKQEFYDYLAELENKGYSIDYKVKVKKISIATGVSAYSFIKELSDVLKQRFGNIIINVFPIENRFFGEYVTVSGLLTGQDIVAQLKDKDLGDELLISDSMLKAGETIFLDDYTVEMVESQLDIKLSAVKNSGKDFIEKILKIGGDEIEKTYSCNSWKT